MHMFDQWDVHDKMARAAVQHWAIIVKRVPVKSKKDFLTRLVAGWELFASQSDVRF